MMTLDADAARKALAAKDMAEHDLARLATCPPWRHAAFGGLYAALVFSPVLPLPWRFPLLAAVLVAVGLLVRSDRRRLGVFVNGYRRGRTRLITFPMLAVFLVLYVGSYVAVMKWEQPMVAVALTMAAFVSAWLGSIMWQRVFARELGA